MGGGVSGAGAVGPEDKDKDGSFRVPGYRGVWVNPAGKHFIKIGGVSLMIETDEGETEKEEVLLFDTIEEAARKHDEVVTGTGKGSELNFRPDGTRIVYEDSTAAAAAGRGLEMLGGGASSVVPALSVINIKVREIGFSAVRFFELLLLHPVLLRCIGRILLLWREGSP